MASQIKTTLSTLKSTMIRAAFVRGFKEARKGLPMDYDCYGAGHETNARWQYERGRQLGCIYSGELKHGRHVTYTAEQAMQTAIYNQWIR